MLFALIRSLAKVLTVDARNHNRRTLACDHPAGRIVVLAAYKNVPFQTQPLQQHVFGEAHRCAAYECSKEKEIGFCGECDQFPCDHLHPYADMAGQLPHNIKVFNLCLIRRMGLDAWAESKAAAVRETYFTKPWKLD